MSLHEGDNDFSVKYKIDQDYVSFKAWRTKDSPRMKSYTIQTIESAGQPRIKSSTRESDYKQTVNYVSIKDPMSVYVADDFRSNYSFSTTIENVNHSNGIPQDRITQITAIHDELYKDAK